jgi:DnaA-like protein
VRIDTSSVLAELNRSVGQARRAYLKFMAEGKGAGHQVVYYEVWDQRILGDKNFVEQIDEKIRSEREIELPGPRAKLSKLLRLTAQAYGVTEGELVRPGRQRRWVKPRSALVYLAREWGRVSVKEIGRRLHRDPSIISPLAVFRRLGGEISAVPGLDRMFRLGDRTILEDTLKAGGFQEVAVHAVATTWRYSSLADAVQAAKDTFPTGLQRILVSLSDAERELA